MKIKENVSTDALSLQLIELAPKLDGHKRHRVAVNSGVSIWTVNRYLDGFVKRTMTARVIIEEAKKIAA